MGKTQTLWIGLCPSYSLQQENQSFIQKFGPTPLKGYLEITGI